MPSKSIVSEHSHSHDVTSPRATSVHSFSPEAVSGDVTPRPGIPIPIRSSARSRSTSYSSLYGHPVATRASLVQAANSIASHARSPSPESRRQEDRHDHYLEAGTAIDEPQEDSSERTPLLLQQNHNTTPFGALSSSVTPSDNHSSHAHAHSGSMNMRALVLHVLGDALGNVGVIATGFVIWFSDWKYKYYFDPVISLVITVIIFSSALPLGMC